jgi:hypothetical protein
MIHPHWPSKNYDHADAYVAAHEEETKTRAVIDCGDGIHAILPKGLPALKIRFHGLFMIAPLPLLMACVIFLPLSGFLGEWEINTTTLGISLLCLVMLAGLIRVILVMLNVRDMFPREYFVTLGPEGLAMHFSRIHFPAGHPKAFIPWNEVASTERISVFFLPALLLGRLSVPALRVAPKKGAPVIIPLCSHKAERENDFERIENLIRSHRPG